MGLLFFTYGLGVEPPTLKCEAFLSEVEEAAKQAAERQASGVRIPHADGEIMYSEKGTDVHKENIRIKLPKGQYWFSMTAEAGFELSVSIE